MTRPPKELVDAICESLRDRPGEWVFRGSGAYYAASNITVSLDGDYGLPTFVGAGYAFYRISGLATWPWHWLASWRRELRRCVIAARAKSDWVPKRERERQEAREIADRMSRLESESVSDAITTLRGAS